MALGRDDPEALLAGMGARRWAGWLAYMKREPFGGPREDYRMGALMELVYGALAGRKGRSVRWWEWFPEHTPDRDLRGMQSPEEVWRRLVEGARRLGGA